MLSLIKARQLFFVPAFISIFLLLFYCLLVPRQDSFLLLNHWHSYWPDQFFIYYTYTGDGITSILIIILLAVASKKKEAVTVLTAYGSSGIVAQLLKNGIAMPRPKLYLHNLNVHYQFIQGLNVHEYNSFPSGHAASAFALATVLSLVIKSKVMQVLLFFLAGITAYSRVYLGQHFLEDVTAGAATGILFGVLSYYFIWRRPLRLPLPLLRKRQLYNERLLQS